MTNVRKNIFDSCDLIPLLNTCFLSNRYTKYANEIKQNDDITLKLLVLLSAPLSLSVKTLTGLAK